MGRGGLRKSRFQFLETVKAGLLNHSQRNKMLPLHPGAYQNHVLFCTMENQ